jgi:formiminotetrahydrofolate cyclodeaminase
MAQAALRGAALNVRTNLRSLRNKTLAGDLEEQLTSLETRAQQLMTGLEKELAERI